ncbi:N-6 DNA methylase [candidate division WOR-3 bacterium]|nr:N-6 DNA methylase [candidate division WOR-3 bacterium]
MLKSYLKEIFKVAMQGDAREESFYSSLEGLLREYSESVGRGKIHITTLPKKTEAGNPDFRVWDGKQHIVGYIEAKAPTVEYLDQIETTEQLKRYRHIFPNLILTNFFEFRLYRNGTLIDNVRIGRPFVMHRLKTVPPVEKEPDFLELLEKFFSFLLPKVYSAKTLAEELAKRTSFLKDEVITQELKEEESQGKGFISGFYEAFRKYLISGLTKDDFADLYSQTITYGLFAARTRSENEFNRKLAYDNIPHTIGILREVFEFISLGDLPPQMEWIVDDIAEVLAVSDVKNILSKFFHEGKGKDPIVHFYETFLAEYDPKTREKRGVYYTPEPVVSYIVRSLDNILKKHFNRQDGFASDSVTVLDPAAGTLTFLAEAAKLAVEGFVSKYGKGGKENFIKEHILKNFYAFELMMAPYAVGHLKMSFLLEELGYRLQKEDRFKLYLTNTLEMEELGQTELPGMSSLAEESHLAGEVKKEYPILVILGNPPYSVSSSNKSKFIEKEMILYKEDVREEKNIQPLSDDYIKFIRFAQWKIDKAGIGVIGMITNNSYLSGLIHRGMRKKLLESFNEIYILNLHGNSRIGEKCPDGSKDENVFDIMQGVSICLFIKNKRQKGLAETFYQDVFGLREMKYAYLSKNNIRSIKWKKLTPTESHYFFVEKDFILEDSYKRFVSTKSIFIKYNAGIATGKDKILVDFQKNTLVRKLSAKDKDTFYLLMKTFGLKKELISKWYEELKEKDVEGQIKQYAYRLFDRRFIIYNEKILQRARKSIMNHMLHNNISIILTKQLAKLPFKHCFVSIDIGDRCLISLRTKELGYFFPLYLHPQKSDPKKRNPGSTAMLFESQEDYKAKTPNLSRVIVEQLKKSFKKTPPPEEIFHYIYAILYSNIYRSKYAEFLKIDFPRVPFTKDYKLFSKMGKYGKKLVELHLLESKELDPPTAKFQGEGDDKVVKLKYDEKEKRLYLNQNQYYSGISKEIYQYQIGGYQVCHKWLKDRKGRRLSLNEIKHYCKIITALQKTIEIQKEIDKIYPAVEKKILEFSD